MLLKFGECVEESVYYVPFCTHGREQLHMLWNPVLILTYERDGNGFYFD
jgi:hypothetical protein